METDQDEQSQAEPRGITSGGEAALAGTLAEAIRARRRQLNMKQSELAAELGVTGGLVSQWETGRTRVLAQDLTRIARALKMDV